MSSAKQPTWHAPAPAKAEQPQLKLYNSLTRLKTVFVPQRPGHVAWYQCGITPYAPLHLGHLKLFMHFDLVRRVLADHFGYNVYLVLNFTDVDDKIIVAARHQYLFDEKVRKQYTEVTDELLKYSLDSWKQYVAKNLPEYTGEATPEAFLTWQVDPQQFATEKPKFPMYHTAATNGAKAITNKVKLSDFLPAVEEFVSIALDKEYGASVTDPEIFRKLPYHWENRFLAEMETLNVLPPLVTTRVTEYIPEIIAYVEKIVANGYAYATADGLVYFDVVKFENSPNHDYAKLAPWSKGDLLLIADGEGLLSTGDGKRNLVDFALWKALKPGEPFWQLPWGKGRPGWHIECLVMALDMIGDVLDIHSGGIDLCFPHHDNELAQLEAYYNNQQWVNYFLHLGHLHIQGQKMLKSLKNFITIEEALAQHSPRQLRLVFAMTQWDKPMDFKDSLVHEVKTTEATFSKFFTKVRALVDDYNRRIAQGEIILKKLGDVEKQLLKDLTQAQDDVHAALCDNINTLGAIQALGAIVSKTNTYLSGCDTGKSELRIEPVVDVAQYVTQTLAKLGFTVREDGLGWALAASQLLELTLVEKVADPYYRLLAQFRDLVRQTAINKGDMLKILAACDQVRADLLNLNVLLDDRPPKKNDELGQMEDQAALIKFLSDDEKHAIIKQQQEKEREARAKEAKKAAAAAEAAKKAAERLEKLKVAPQDMFRDASLYLEWDDQGIPTKDAKGEEVSKSAKKKLMKQWQQQEKLHNEYLQLKA